MLVRASKECCWLYGISLTFPHVGIHPFECLALSWQWVRGAKFDFIQFFESEAIKSISVHSALCIPRISRSLRLATDVPMKCLLSAKVFIHVLSSKKPIGSLRISPYLIKLLTIRTANVNLMAVLQIEGAKNDKLLFDNAPFSSIQCLDRFLASSCKELYNNGEVKDRTIKAFTDIKQI